MYVQLPLPNPQDWVGIEYVMKRCRVTRQTVYRWGGRGQFAYAPPLLTIYRAQDSSAVMFWRDEVERLAAARSVVRGTGYTATAGVPAVR